MHKFYVVGQGSLVIECINYLISQGHTVMGVVTLDRELSYRAEQKGIDSYSSLEQFQQHFVPHDYLLSINNPLILPPAILKLPTYSAINYHDGPLPRYSGLNATSWAIINQERMHAITWHEMTEYVDEGDVLVQEWIDLSPEETAFTLNLKCYELACRTFKDLIKKIELNELVGVKQNLAEKTYYGAYSKPKTFGFIDLHKSAEEISALVRGLYFGHYENPLATAKFIYAERIWIVEGVQITQEKSVYPPGTIVSISNEGVVCATADLDIYLHNIYCVTGKEINFSNLVNIGEKISKLNEGSISKLNAIGHQAAISEKYWIDSIGAATKFQLPTYLQFNKKINQCTRIYKSEHIDYLTKNYNAEPSIVWLTLLVIYFCRIQQTSISLGLQINQDVSLSDSIKSFFSNIVPLNVNLDLTADFATALSQTQEKLVEINKQGVFFADLSQRYHNLKGLMTGGGFNSSVIVLLSEDEINFDNTMCDKLIIRISKKQISFNGFDTEKFLDHLDILINDIIKTPKKSLQFLNIIPASELTIIDESNNSFIDYDNKRLLQDMFLDIAFLFPNKIAVISGDKTLTYEQLLHYSTSLANFLVNNRCSQNEAVGIVIDKGWRQIVACLGILMAGLIFIPINPREPIERRNKIIESSRINIVIDESIIDQAILEYKPLEIDVKRDTDDIAYVIYTSGSTGQPKGVMISHRSIVNTILDINKKFNVSEQDRVLALSALTFDLAIYDIFGLLSVGGVIVIPEHGSEKSPEHWVDLIELNKITLWNSVPTSMQMLVDYCDQNKLKIPSSIKTILLSGDWILPELVKSIYSQRNDVNLVSLGGATEASIWSIYYLITNLPVTSKYVPYGIPLGNQKFYILDNQFQALPLGVIGELYIGGIGVGCGYLNDPKRTSEAFIMHPELNQKIYRTGDLGYYNEKGEIIFIGRRDGQVKLSGFRVEIGEIEFALKSIPSVAEAVVKVDQDLRHNKQRLVAYLKLKDDADHLITKNDFVVKLPEYMRPNFYRRVGNFPLNGNGKIDYKQLTIDYGSSLFENIDSGIISESQKLFISILSRILLIEESVIDYSASFYEIGGDSLDAIKIIAQLSACGLSLNINEFFDRTSILAISQKLIKLGSEDFGKEDVQLVKNVINLTKNTINKNIITIYPQTKTQSGIHYSCQITNNPGLYIVNLLVVLEGVVVLSVFEQALKLIIEHYEVLRTGFDSDNLTAFVLKSASLNIHYVDLTSLDIISQEIEINNYFNHKKLEGINVENPPLIKLAIFKLTATHWKLSITYHHMLFDGISAINFLELLIDVYSNLINKTKQIAFKPMNSFYRDNDAYDVNRVNYWRKLLENFSGLNGVKYSGNKNSINYRSYETKISIADTLAKSRLSTLIYSAWAIALSKLSSEAAVCFGIAFTSSKNTAQDLGLFINILPLVINVKDLSFNEIHKQVFEQINSIQQFPNESWYGVKNCLKIDRNNELFTTLVMIDSFSQAILTNDSYHEDSLLVRDISIRGKTHFPLSLTVTTRNDYLSIKLDYLENFISNENVKMILDDFISHFNSDNKRIDVFSEKKNDLLKINDFDSWEFFAKNNPDKAAIEFSQSVLTYSQLVERVNKFVNYLRCKQINEGDYVLLAISRGFDLVISILALLKIGAIFVPIEPDYSAGRVYQILDDLEPSLIITDNNNLISNEHYSDVLVVLANCSDEISKYSTSVDSVSYPLTECAYAIYTSGTTGQPKGIEIYRHSLLNVLRSMGELVAFTEDDKFAAITSISFDISILELLLPLLYGATIVLFNKSISRDAISLAQHLDKSDITIMQATPSTWQMLLNADWQNKSGLRAISGGEVLSVTLANDLLNLIPNLWNAYGPTETTIWSTVSKLSKPLDEVTIGKPIANTQCVIVDNGNQITRPDTIGELYIGGTGVAKGYLNRSKLTKNSFIENTELGSGRLYKTGDLVKYDNNNDLIFISRVDRQIKFRGYRVELNAIEAKIAEAPNVGQVAVECIETLEKAQEIVVFIQPKATLSAVTQSIDFSLSFFAANADDNNQSIYDLYIKSAKYADENGFKAIWTPERHFNPVGGAYPNPSILSAALAAVTTKIKLRAGSVVLPLHQPLRVVEEWSVVDNLSNGRMGLAVASGWHPQDFILSPNRFNSRKDDFLKSLTTLKQLWAGEAVEFLDGENKLRSVKCYPKPVQTELPIWIAASGNEQTFIQAGKMGVNILTHLLEQDIPDLSDKIQSYRLALSESGYDPQSRTVTVMLHTYVTDNNEIAISSATEPLFQYFRAHINLLNNIQKTPSLLLDDEKDDALVKRAVARCLNGHSLIGSPEQCMHTINKLASIGVNEISCLIDFGVAVDEVLDNLKNIKKLMEDSKQFFVKKRVAIDVELIKSSLLNVLPEYMIPEKFLIIEDFNYANSGKIDRAALKKSYISNNAHNPISTDAISFDQQIIKSIWKSVIGINSISITDNFFEIGGHSLLATQVLSRIKNKFKIEISLQVFFKDPTILSLSKLISNNSHPDFLKITKQNRKELLPLSFAQERMFFLYQIEPDSLRYNDIFAFKITGNINFKFLKNSFEKLIERHEVLRTSFVNDGGLIKQKVLEAIPFELPIIDLTNNNDLLEVTLESISRKPFNLAEPPIFGAHLLRLNVETHILLFSMHHIVTDGWSFAIFLRDLSLMYKKMVSGEQVFLPELPVQYGDFSSCQRHFLKNNFLDSQLQFWASHLAGDLPILNLPTDYSRPVIERFSGSRFEFKIAIDLVQKIHLYCRKYQITIFGFLLSSYAVLLSKICNQDECIIGTPIANRNHIEVEDLIGCFVNVLPIRIKIDKQTLVNEFIDNVSDIIFNAYSNQDAPIEKVIKDAGLSRDLSASVLFQTMFVFHNTPARVLNLGDAIITEYNFHLNPSRLDLTLGMEETNQHLSCYFEYNIDLFKLSKIEKFSNYLIEIIEQLLVNEESAISQITLGKNLNIPKLNNLEKFDTSAYLNDMLGNWRKQVELHPNKIAIKDTDKQLTFLELDALSALYSQILVNLGVKTQDRVLIAIPRNLEAIALLIAIMRIGAVYVAVDEDMPLIRILTIIEDVKPILVISTDQFQLSQQCDAKIISLSNFILAEPIFNIPYAIIKPEYLIYISYTSGSTGKPKGVKISHRAVCQFISSKNQLYIDESDCIAQMATLAFDASTFEIWGSLLNGASVAVIDKETVLDPHRFKNALDFLSITACYLSASLFQKYIQILPETFSGMKTVIFGGEAINISILRNYLKNYPIKPKYLLHAYGPTEATTFSTIFDTTNLRDSDQYCPIGKPLNHFVIYILDENLNLLPQGLVGEIYISGLGLASGYWNDLDHTERHFVIDPFNADESKFYRSGDLGYINDQNDIVYVGRKDLQIKIRGYRVEPSEIEACLIEHPLVQNAIVLADMGEQSKHLFAYIEKGHNHSDEMSNKHISMWRKLYDDLYRSIERGKSTSLDFDGWISSYTQKAIPEDEMNDWLNATINQIAAFKPKRILEIGVGTGLLMNKLINNCELYVGTDFSEEVINHLRLKNQDKYRNLILYQLDASSISEIKEANFDLIIFNSIVQYFPNDNYLNLVLNKCIPYLAPDKGRIFIGDIRNYDLRHAFHAALLKSSRFDVSVDTFKSKLLTAINQEYELLISPAYFNSISLNDRKPYISILYKDAVYHNEMSLYRYNVILDFNVLQKIEEPTWIDWQKIPINLQSIKKKLLTDTAAFLAIKNIVNARTYNDITFYEWLSTCEVNSSVNEFKSGGNDGIDPHHCYELGFQLGLDVEVSLGKSSKYFDVIFSSNKIKRDVKVSKINYHFDMQNEIFNYPVQSILNQSDLTAFLKQKLPAYMIPNKFIFLDKFPVTVTGKIDRQALLEVSTDKSNIEVFDKNFSTLTKIELSILNIWREILRLDNISIDDNFFELGGDSIISIHFLAKARQNGIQLSPKDIFRYQTIRELAQHSRMTQEESTVDNNVEGNIQLTPIQGWFFEHNFKDRHHWNMAYMLKLTRFVDSNVLEAAFKRLLEHHESLRIRFSYTNDKYTQFYDAGFDNLIFETIDLSGYENDAWIKAISVHANACQASLNIESGPLIKAILFNIADSTEQRMVIVIHHLIMDSVSWYIILQDLMTITEQITSNRIISLPKRTHSFKTWSDQLNEYAQSSELLNELPYWNKISQHTFNAIPHDYPNGKNLTQNTEYVRLVIDKPTTDKIIYDLPKIFHNKINDVLLSCLALSVLPSITNGVLVNLDSHGRDNNFSNIDITRTVGWFTAVYPIYLRAVSNNLELTLKQTSIMLNEVPNKGLGYGLLRYLCKDKAINEKMHLLPEALIGFNYFGQFFQNISSDSLFDRADESPGSYRSPLSKRIYEIEINGYVYQGEFHFEFAYSADIYKLETIKAIADKFSNALSGYADLAKNKFATAENGLIELQNYKSINQAIAVNKPKIFMIHPIGGQTHWYRELNKLIGNDYPFHVIESVGLYDDVEAYSTVEEMAEHYLQDIVKDGYQGSYIIGGWSFGCEVAFEISKRLLNIGFDVPLTIILDPQMLTNETDVLIRGIKRTFADDYRIHLDVDLSLGENLAFDECIDYLLNLNTMTTSNLGNDEANHQLKRFLKVYRNNLKALHHYEKSGTVNHVLLMQASTQFKKENDPIISPSSILEWTEISKKVSHHVIDGDHYSILTGSNVEKIASQIKFAISNMEIHTTKTKEGSLCQK